MGPKDLPRIARAAGRLAVGQSGANSSLEKPNEELKSVNTAMTSPNIHSQATAYAKLAESDAVKTGALKSSAEKDNLYDESGLFIVLPISAESTGMLPIRKGFLGQAATESRKYELDAELRTLYPLGGKVL
ncbi:hypothetical protein C1H46_032292 [Malus baccata]|uniref:Uncharacterized protein n=1 Tax=Malus baccata TaxID=106549 RepID=A0A540L6Q5_MALBA|nr:hypothetical protein C1H46_032292 [Malus baccata]